MKDLKIQWLKDFELYKIERAARVAAALFLGLSTLSCWRYTIQWCFFEGCLCRQAKWEVLWFAFWLVKYSAWYQSAAKFSQSLSSHLAGLLLSAGHRTRHISGIAPTCLESGKDLLRRTRRDAKIRSCSPILCRISHPPCLLWSR